MTLSEQVLDRLNRGLDEFQELDIREDHSRPGATYFDLFLYPGAHGGKDWQILLPVCIENDAVTLEAAEICDGNDGDFDQVAVLGGDVSKVPPAVLDAANALTARVSSLGLEGLAPEASSPAP